MEDTSSEDLEWFFDQWLTRSVSPAVKIAWHYDESKKEVVIDIEQTQDGDHYALRIEIAVVDTAGRRTKVAIVMESDKERITVAQAVAPSSLIVDPDTKSLLRWEIIERKSPARP